MDLSKKGIPELTELLDEITLSMAQKFTGVKVNKHCGFASAFGLPMPHLNEGDNQQAGAVTNSGINIDSGYDLENANVTIVEELQNESEEDGLRTLQFNSLCIRRPSTSRRQYNMFMREEGNDAQNAMQSGSILAPNKEDKDEKELEESETDSSS